MNIIDGLIKPSIDMSKNSTITNNITINVDTVIIVPDEETVAKIVLMKQHSDTEQTTQPITPGKES